jgi:hypothetical protein
VDGDERPDEVVFALMPHPYPRTTFEDLGDNMYEEMVEALP